jgi:acyl-CoA reductase-like NAD-dependent aldehyde dehydrogenase
LELWLALNRFDLLIGGRWEKSHSGRYKDVINPSNGSVVAQCALADKTDVGKAIDVAREAFENGEWSQLPLDKRADVLRKAAEIMKERAEELAMLEMANCGKPIRQASFFDVPTATACMEYYATLQAAELRKRIEQPDFPGTYGIIDHEPYGVVGAIVPWNVPILMTAWKLAPALLAGNSVVLKPSHLTPLTALKLGEILYQAGLPHGTLSVTTGVGREVGGELASSRNVDVLSFTGSTETGKEVMQLAASNVKKTLLELGGKSPNIVLDDADLESAVKGSMFAVFLHSGQLCESGTRLLLADKIYDAFMKNMKTRVDAMRMGPTDSMETDLGPLISREQLDRVESYITIGANEGARMLCGGPVNDPALKSGHYIRPTVFTEVRPEMKIAKEEIFGPVLTVIKFKDEEELVKISNDTVYGLASAVWSKDLQKALRIGRRIRAGTVWINDYHLLTAYAPRGGYKQSGFGRELGQEGLHEYMQTKHYFINEKGDVEETAYTLISATT